MDKPWNLHDAAEAMGDVHHFLSEETKCMRDDACDGQLVYEMCSACQAFVLAGRVSIFLEGLEDKIIGHRVREGKAHAREWTIRA
jgi:hypothetical protein